MKSISYLLTNINKYVTVSKVDRENPPVHGFIDSPPSERKDPMCHAEYRSAKALMDARLREVSRSVRRPSTTGLESSPAHRKPSSLQRVVLLLAAIAGRLTGAWHTLGPVSGTESSQLEEGVTPDLGRVRGI